MFSEKDMQYIIRDHPEHFFGQDVSLYQRECWICTDSRIDFVLLDNKNKRHLLVEVQKGKLDSEHSDKLWKRYMPNYKIMRPDVEIKGILVANLATSEMIRINQERGIDVKCYTPEEILSVDKTYVMKDIKASRKAIIGQFTGFELDDFEKVLEAEKQINPEIRLKAMGKLYQIRDYLLPKLETLFPNDFIDTKVSDRINTYRLDVPWMAYYFGTRDNGGTNIPHINITLRDVSETGQMHHTDLSVHVNAEIKESFLSVLNAFREQKEIMANIDKIKEKDYSIRFYSKIPIKPQNTNNNFWIHRNTWEISKEFHPREIINWFEMFNRKNIEYFEEEIKRVDNIYDPDKFPDFTKYPKQLLQNTHDGKKKNACPGAHGRSVFRIGKWWSIAYVIGRGAEFKYDVLYAIRDLYELLEFFKRG